MDTILLDIQDNGRKILNPIKWIAMFAGCNTKYRIKFLHPMKILNLFLFMTSALACFGQLFYIWERRHQTFEKYSEAILIFFQSLISIWKLWLFTFSQDSIFEMIQSVETSELLKDMEIFQLDLIDEEHIVKDIFQILKDSWIDIKRQLLLNRATVFGICSWYSGHCLVSNIYYLYIGNEDMLQFPFPASFPVWYQGERNLWHFFVEYIIVTMQIYMATVGSITCSGLFSIISVHCLTLIRVLRKLIEYSTSEHVPPRNRCIYTKACIKLHQQILSFCNRLNNLFKAFSLGLFATCCLLICLLTFKATFDMGNDISASIKVCLYLLAAFYELLIYCLNGQRITSESELLPTTIYNCAWFEENRHFQHMIHTMIMKTNNSIQLDVGGFARMSSVTLLTIVRSSVSYFLFLQKCM
ncbi:odorant receptor 63a-like [Musca autumnalis]|uniref:odorant receptor 63a-like n=1 Tax=Musca autumnalis TaxID=221902 RepID=UPI003CEDA79E